LIGTGQRWIFEPPRPDWRPPHLEQTSLYLHVPFCHNCCPYCPYTKIPYDASLLEPYTRAASAEVDWWADNIGPAEITSVYIGGGTPTLALGSVVRVLDRMRERFQITGEICIETNPADVDVDKVRQLQDAGVTLVSLGVQSFQADKLALLGRRYEPDIAKKALELLVKSGFASINVDLMFALPDQTLEEVLADLTLAEQLGADQITTYPIFTFPYTAVGEYLDLRSVRMPNLHTRRAHYRAIHEWSVGRGFERVSVWGFKRNGAPRYSSVTRKGYVGIGPGAGSHLPDGFLLNTFDIHSWIQAMKNGRRAVALQMPFTREMSAWWWLYWRLYDTRVSAEELDIFFKEDAARVRRWLNALEMFGLMREKDAFFELTQAGAFWIHLAQNYFALNYINTLWTSARREPWPQQVVI
jgi:oxygen-independent coproporphyrinogen-3 oxidase